MEKNIRMDLNDGGYVFETCQYSQSKVATVILNSVTANQSRDYFIANCSFAIPIDVTITEKRKGEVGDLTPKSYNMIVVGKGMPASVSYKNGHLGITLKTENYNWRKANISFEKTADKEKWQNDYKQEAVDEIFSKIIEEVSKDRTWTEEDNFKAISQKEPQQQLAKVDTLDEVLRAFRNFNKKALREDKVVNRQNHVIALNFTTDSNGKIQSRDDQSDSSQPVIGDSFARRMAKSMDKVFEAVYRSDLNNFREGYEDDFYTGSDHVPSGDYAEYADYDIYDDCDKGEIQDLEHAEWNKELDDEYWNEDNLYQDRLVDQYRESLNYGSDTPPDCDESDAKIASRIIDEGF